MTGIRVSKRVFDEIYERFPCCDVITFTDGERIIYISAPDNGWLNHDEEKVKKA